LGDFTVSKGHRYPLVKIMGIHEGILHWAKHINNNNGKKFKFKWEHAMKEGHKLASGHNMKK
jgi:hypothetical protein